MSMRLSELLVGLLDVPASRDLEVAAIAQDSREVTPGAVFLAVPGESGDGRNYIGQAIDRGAVAIVAETGRELPACDVPLFVVEGLSRRIGFIASRFFGEPSRRLRVVGVTGTNGKTTCTQLLAQALDAPPARCGVMGTLGAGFPDALAPGLHTTPGPVQLHRTFAQLADAGATSVAMEVSSHALEQGRVQGTVFEAAVFTNLTRDHLDYHGDMDAYGNAKAKLFAWPGLRAAIINIDDAFGRALLARLGGALRVLTYGFGEADVRATGWQTTSEGIEVAVETPLGPATLRVPLLGRFNVANALAVTATLIALGRSLDEIAAKLAAVKPVPGRMERFARGAGPVVVVDYAHTPDALENVLKALREHARGKLWCVFGCGGDRDRGKRPLMGAIAQRYADVVVVTDDNPRTESPEQILTDIVAGMRAAPRVLRDREAAITTAVREAGEGDVVLIAGKGHEDYQQIGDRRIPFSDRKVVQAVLGLAA